jgi:predicted nucleotidyltransferase
MLARLLEQIAIALEERHIPYMVIGGQAVLVYGEPRLTQDVDVTLGVGPERLVDILNIAKAQNWRLLVEDPEDFVYRTLVLPCLDTETQLRIDLIFSHSEYERQAMDRVRRIVVGKAQVRFASLEDVIIHKVIAGRPRDLEDVRGILLKSPPSQAAYIRKWLLEFDRSLGGGYLQVFEELAQFPSR